ncbi:hypothetical protein [Roseobacter sp.]|uniref:hypothetical protein n=1 Tax=Roseobacter sp. TaxID=1907202 RepID=UPI003297C47E
METELTDKDKAKIADARWREDTDDFQNAIAGRDTGRQMRFGGQTRDAENAERKKSERAYQDALDRLLQDPAYRALYEELGTRLSEAERNADQTIAAIETALEAVEDEIADMETNAAKGPDGAPVFRTADGRVVNADGEELPPEIAEGIQWPPNAPSAEDYFDAKGRHDALITSLDDWRKYRNDTLGGIRDRHEDRGNPMTKDEIGDALEEIDSARPDTVALEASTVSAEAEITVGPVAFPTIGG